ncbi:hypothetical protein A3J20_06295 [Candidatus Gottesmanbacteria bacterium RIFCSPLOWO2_02_FULL_42_29]|uniref:Oligoendopeptidase F n=2 Tax=Candidatus Gottesmaniibacteriota TaxID=1752720 RepID=A0A1F6BHF8_9BACT|nr:MAG: Oligoendopeptidase F [Candidatus Gottesmanbacteria bacterium GW2011_GWA2_42_18]KKS76235.1 MAG: Oligoendopeptidase F [Candidatus Gottesmanbacteria bacterium GW2011_GWC2_42_8]OGG11202.1 MAG: hypothetical protein A2781_05460 [Candidatus Gottesmanbacteria bacterium RIFCSPHIGHO2_01_FULL_42_27]OGG21266.1 MAG: hypothetical protein A3E72_05030 [Candidatus Gottesmanbacteria bacterium RIFCSPHIGHO2_12_FULL_43_26]OGG33665.1 MAG: hypothetical protein A3G68_02535 [Candidatus Gottesmanbacteria bacteri
MALHEQVSQAPAPQEQRQSGPQLTWDLSPLFDGDNDPRIAIERGEIEAASQDFIGKWGGDRTDYLRDPDLLRQALDDYAGFLSKSGNGGGSAQYYFQLRAAQNQSDPDIKAKKDMIDDFAIGIQDSMRFFRINIAQIPLEIQQELIASPALQEYQHWLGGRWAEVSHLLSEGEENILARLELGAYEDWMSMTSKLLSRKTPITLDADGRRRKKPFTSLGGVMRSPDKAVRDDAARAFNQVVEINSDVAEHELNAILRHRKDIDHFRNFDRPDAQRHLQDDVDSTVVDALVAAVTKRFDIAKRFYQLKAKLLGVPQLEYHERNVEMIFGGKGRTYTYEEAVDLVHSVMGELDPEFGEIFTRFVQNRQLDVFPRQGKTGGAFCAYDRLTTPTYILLNHTGILNDVTTLAHESGHGINNELMRNRQNELNFATSTATAEVASTFMEDFVLQRLLDGVDDRQRMEILMEKLNDEIGAIPRQVACYRFEQALHGKYREKGYLSKSEIGALFQEHMAAYMGDAVEQSKGSENWWVAWPHIRYYFYVSTYASGLLISKSLQRMVKQDPGRIADVKEFLSAGTSESPQDIFARLGIDISDPKFWDQGLDEIEAEMAEVEALARKLGKIDNIEPI